ncbi:DUF2164 domain-containing protein [Senegalia massiliensis]|uniref:DUF2164 family protein n=1 Tax=Senegalia massiliensis TaxID=1720316 RepID=A0A845R0A5_9CLOT|nr:DUF2164 domain-containing protein [Senegalia massiliensis]NBI07429.1 DUF2164 family protein [Senegalia massiliensis]
MDRKIKINKDKKLIMIGKIKDYFLKERGDDLGDLAAELVLDFFIEELAPDIYNTAIEDSYTYINDKLQDLFALQIVKRK